MLTPTRPKPNGSDEWQHRPELHTDQRGGERSELLGREEAIGYLPPNAGQAGTAHHRTERWEPQAEGKQQEGTFKPLVKNHSHAKPRERHAGSLEVKVLASHTENCPDLRGH